VFFLSESSDTPLTDARLLRLTRRRDEIRRARHRQMNALEPVSGFMMATSGPDDLVESLVAAPAFASLVLRRESWWSRLPFSLQRRAGMEEGPFY
jgi:hypothetical protein